MTSVLIEGDNMVYVVGAGLTKVGNHWDKSLRHLAVEASLMALEDYGKDVDYIVVANALSGVVSGQENLGSYVATHLGKVGLPAVKVEAAGASGGAAVLVARGLISSGLADRVLVVGVEKLTDYTALEDSNSALSTVIDSEYEAFPGGTLDAMHAMVMRAYMNKYGLSKEEFSYLPLLMHENAVDTPHAQLRFKLKPQSYASSPVIAEPLNMLDLAPVGDGAAAIVLSKEADGKNGNAEIVSSGQATDSISIYRRKDLTEMPSIKAAYERALERAPDFKPDFYIIHDYSSAMGYIAVEELGLAQRGKASQLFSSGEARRDGSTPINPEGGLKARGNPVGATGVYQVAEAYLQVTGRAEGWQVQGARSGLTLSVGGVGSNSVVHLIRGV
ncbi:MAG TPA: hypothetical protein ENF57_00345 [Candidatus Korarchaeota archaeon]|nr:hypothetical protein [Candidatus Korarchaeota archaeon]